ncbi:Uncharacterised protein [Shigella sonnei]|nr:Uncharacterised protein [Shigella sonnei]
MVAHAIYRPQFTMKAVRQFLRLMNRVINRCLTRFVFIGIRLRHAQRHRTNFVKTRLQRAIQQGIQFV